MSDAHFWDITAIGALDGNVLELLVGYRDLVARHWLRRACMPGLKAWNWPFYELTWDENRPARRYNFNAAELC
ncbi:hypothetical protein [Bradyrhizobium ottawaense]|uniref:hypothetical protein n=1 Tax=Bradyrhizobium ottawaense TaxID=931866 RepID=UPI003F9FF064